MRYFENTSTRSTGISPLSKTTVRSRADISLSLRSQLKLSEGKQVVTSDDVNALMATMGSVNDFKAAEEQEVGGASAGSQQQQEQKATQLGAKSE